MSTCGGSFSSNSPVLSEVMILHERAEHHCEVGSYVLVWERKGGSYDIPQKVGALSCMMNFWRACIDEAYPGTTNAWHIHVCILKSNCITHCIEVEKCSSESGAQ